MRGFAPICGKNAFRLILGSMPGAASLQANEYYAHPRNAFWTITEALFGIARGATYPARVRALESAGIAVWDVLQECRRRGSLDSDIERDSIVTNEFDEFLRQNPGIQQIYFNGNTARQLYDQHVRPGLTGNRQLIPGLTLPSTSPANARLSQQQKIQAWSVISRCG